MSEIIFLVEEAPESGYQARALGHSIYSQAETMEELIRHGYRVTRQTGSHIRLTPSAKGAEHHITIPRHGALKVGTLSAILKDIAGYLGIDWRQLANNLFGR